MSIIPQMMKSSMMKMSYLASWDHFNVRDFLCTKSTTVQNIVASRALNSVYTPIDEHWNDSRNSRVHIPVMYGTNYKTV